MSDTFLLGFVGYTVFVICVAAWMVSGVEKRVEKLEYMLKVQGVIPQ